MTNRRNFLKKAATSTAMLTFAALPGFSAKSYFNIIGANDRVRLGGVGVNSRGLALAENFAKMKGCSLDYVCDVDSKVMAKCAAAIKKITGTQPKEEVDMHRLFENKDIDAVFMATPEHWHAPGALMAMQAGKDVYLEKPTSHNPAENETLIKAVNKYKRVFQTGMQRRSWPNVIKGIQEIKDGTIGKVYFGKAWYVNNRPSIGIGKTVPIPESLNWELWQGPAPRVKEYKDNYLHYNWHWFHNWGTGESGNNGVHFVDVLRWGMDLSYPTAISSFGGRYHYNDDWQFPDTQVINMEFGKDKMITWEGRSCNGRSIENGSVGCIFYGEKGSLVIEGGDSYKIYDLKNNLIKDIVSNMKFNDGDLMNPTEQLDAFHLQNFLDGIKKGAPQAADVEVGGISSTLAQLGNISQRVGTTIQINPQNGYIINNKEAQKYWGRKYEKGWEMKL